MKQFSYYLFLAVVFTLVGWFGHSAYTLPKDSGNPITVAIPRPTPLAKYTIENLSKVTVPEIKFEIPKEIKKRDNFTSYEFNLVFDPTFSNNKSKKVSGLINLPNKDGKFPAVVMYRGFVPKEQFFTGNGSLYISEYFAEKGFITVAPDFLGYGASDMESENIFEARFQTYTTALATLKSLEKIEKWDGKNVFIWGHSNGGQISLTALEVTGQNYPTVLWAPVTKPFPYSILYYTDDASDGGKFLRRETVNFENDYDSSLYSLTNYLDRINAPLQINQGTADDAVPILWSNLFVKSLREQNKEVTYITYPGADHNLNPRWNEAAENALNFYRKFLK